MKLSGGLAFNIIGAAVGYVIGNVIASGFNFGTEIVWITVAIFFLIGPELRNI